MKFESDKVNSEKSKLILVILICSFFKNKSVLFNFFLPTCYLKTLLRLSIFFYLEKFRQMQLLIEGKLTLINLHINVVFNIGFY